jgi:hypothetical protein
MHENGVEVVQEYYAACLALLVLQSAVSSAQAVFVRQLVLHSGFTQIRDLSGDFARSPKSTYILPVGTATYVLGVSWRWCPGIDSRCSICRCLLAFKTHRTKQLPQRDRRRLKRLAWVSRRKRSSRSNCSKCRTVLIVVKQRYSMFCFI